MSTVNVNYFHLADAASVDSGGKVNILGIFDALNLSQVPSKHPKFTIVVNLLFKKFEQPKNTIQIKIFDPKENEMELKPPIEFDYHANVEKTEEGINLILDLNNIEFRTLGKHKVKLIINNKEIYKKILNVTERSK